MIYYLVFALATGFYSLFLHFIPAVKELELEGFEDPVIDSKVVAYITYWSIATLAAPLIFLTVISSSTNERFKNGIYAALSENDS